MIILAMAGPYGFGICNDVLVQVKNLLTVISTDGNIISSVKKNHKIFIPWLLQFACK